MKSDEISGIVRCFRPTLWPFIWAHSFAGFVAGLGKQSLGLDLDSWLQGLVAGGVWAVLLGGSAAALTAIFSPSENEPCEGLSEPSQGLPDPHSALDTPHSAIRTPHSKVAWAALVMLLLGLAAAPILSWGYFDAYLIGVILVVVYAAPPIRFAGIRSASLAGQAFGFGALTFYSGYAAPDVPGFRVPLSPLFLVGFILLFLALQLALRPMASKAGFWLYWALLAGGFACLAAAEIGLGNRLGTALLIVPLAGWCAAGLRRDRSQTGEPPLSATAALGLCLVTDAGIALTALLR